MKNRPIRVWRVVCLTLIFVSAGFLVLRTAQQSSWYQQRLYQQLLHGNPDQRTSAAANLARVGADHLLLQGLQSEISQVRELSQRGLEHLWFVQAGGKAYQMLEESYQATDRDDYIGALEILNQLVKKYPGFAEGWNRRAAVHWHLGENEKSLADCQRALALNPNHYGAWQGIGVCHLEAGDLRKACECLRAALKIIPHDEMTRQSLRQCEELLFTFPLPGPSENQKGHLII